MIPSLRRVRSNDNVIRQLQDASDTVFRAITSKQLLDGLFISDVEIISGTEKVLPHGLGRELAGWIVVGKNAEADVWDSQASNPTPIRTLILNAAANVTINLWVF